MPVEIIRVIDRFVRTTELGVFMDSTSISEAQVWNDINNAYDRMNLEQKRVWNVIKVQPEKWRQAPKWNMDKDFWVVAIIGCNVIWFNDIEDGYNQSTYTKFGTINTYWCNQDTLETAVQNIINFLGNGYDSAGRAGPPTAVIKEKPTKKK